MATVMSTIEEKRMPPLKKLQVMHIHEKVHAQQRTVHLRLGQEQYTSANE